MIKDITKVKIGPVWNGGRGATFTDKIIAEPDLGEELSLKSPLEAELMLVRMKDGISAVFSDFSTSVHLNCAKCLDQFSFDIRVESFERQYLATVPDRDFDPLEFFMITMQDMSIDLTEAFRQEIILHFPMIPVCSERCQGLCPSCAANLNHQNHRKDCNYQEEVIEKTEQVANKPLAQLKDLFKQ
jgi:uncharacterized protein